MHSHIFGFNIQFFLHLLVNYGSNPCMELTITLVMISVILATDIRTLKRLESEPRSRVLQFFIAHLQLLR